jgi:hypothetical protein
MFLEYFLTHSAHQTHGQCRLRKRIRKIPHDMEMDVTEMIFNQGRKPQFLGDVSKHQIFF